MYNITHLSGKQQSFNHIPANTYVMTGINDHSEKGLLMVSTDEGLVPLMNNKTGEQMKFTGMTGMFFDGKKWNQ